MIKSDNFTYKVIKFPCGEISIKVKYAHFSESVDIMFDFEKLEELTELFLLCHTIRLDGIKLSLLLIKYMPFGREDRKESCGKSFALKWFCEQINNLRFDNVEIIDPHSDVAAALINNVCVIKQHTLFENFLSDQKAEQKDFYLVAPDAGALKKVYKLAKIVNPLGVVECSKVRDIETGDISRTAVHADDLQGEDCYLVDDICDGGRTFLEAAKVLKTKNAGKINLLVTHGKFTKGLKVLDNFIDNIYSIDLVGNIVKLTQK